MTKKHMVDLCRVPLDIVLRDADLNTGKKGKKKQQS
jgi:hypothetical protein